MRYPDYYNKFNCIADKCQHSCCIGWEIDIDDISYSRFINTHGALGDKLRKNIFDFTFILDEKERCPFLRDDNLCELIINKGNDFLCDICTEHPRFYNCYHSITEMGIGACCEVAVSLILSEDMVLVFDKIDESTEDYNLTMSEKIFFDIRDEYIIKLEKMMRKMVNNCIDERVIYKFMKLERLEEKWSEYLKRALLFARKNEVFSHINDFKDDMCSVGNFSIIDYLRRFATYLVYRHSIKFYEKNTDILSNDSDFEFVKKSFFDVFDNFISDCVAIVWIVFLANYEFYNNFSSHFNECTSEISLFGDDGNVVNLLSDIIRYFSSEVEYSDINLIGWFT